jgi:phosphoglycolate phosphatase
MPTTNEHQFSEWKELFLRRYAEVGYRESQLYPGIQEVLDTLRHKCIPWGIVTNKITALTLPILKSAGLLEKAACVVCGDTLHQSKPHPAPVLHACSLLEVKAGDVMFAGDDVRDIQAGKSAGTKTAAVMYGYGAHEFEADHLAGCAVIRHPSEFVRLIE